MQQIIHGKLRCFKWIINSGRQDFIELKENQIRARYLCSEHFEDSAFSNSLRNRLLGNHALAVPIKFWEDNRNLDLPHKCPNCPKRFPNEENLTSHLTKCKPDAAVILGENVELEKQLFDTWKFCLNRIVTRCTV
uniref:THAP-type domain-containing protein n=1 Tax=Clastoptera arizonana TaxID=38151 RepID=A0A1B6DSX7_9HEMI